MPNTFIRNNDSDFVNKLTSKQMKHNKIIQNKTFIDLKHKLYN